MEQTKNQTGPQLGQAKSILSDRLQEVTDFVSGKPLDQTLQNLLNQRFSSSSDWYREVLSLFELAVQEGWACQYEAGGIRYGRIFKPELSLSGFSLDLVHMDDVIGPKHCHPNGEIDLVFPLVEGAAFDGVSDGWKVYEPGSVHCPTVTGGSAYVMYLLPEGAIEFKDR